MSNMLKRWGRKVNDLAFPEFLHKLEWLALKYGKTVVKIDRWEPTSKKCGSCGSINHDLQLKERIWTCPHCETIHDRDLNAANNIHELGHQLTEETKSDALCAHWL